LKYLIGFLIFNYSQTCYFGGAIFGEGFSEPCLDFVRGIGGAGNLLNIFDTNDVPGILCGPEVNDVCPAVDENSDILRLKELQSIFKAMKKL